MVISVFDFAEVISELTLSIVFVTFDNSFFFDSIKSSIFSIWTSSGRISSLKLSVSGEYVASFMKINISATAPSPHAIISMKDNENGFNCLRFN